MSEANTAEGLDFIRAIIRDDIAAGTHGGKVVTRFPPEPNGFLHIGHAKSICLNFGAARENGGVTHLRFDDTNPTTEDARYVEAMKEDIRWLGFDWGENLFHASDYFERLYDYAEQLIESGKAYVDSSTEEEIRTLRGSVTSAGQPSPYRDRSPQENLDLFRRMRACEFSDGAHVLRARIDMASPNMLMRDPLLYRIRRAHHYRTADDWCIYPLYDFAHGLSDSIEGITHSLCTLEFENNREVYDWLLDNLGVPQPQPRQYEFARLNLAYTVVSKRRLLPLIEAGVVKGWDDPRMPTLAALRRRGVPPSAIRAFCQMIGVAKVENRVDLGKLEYAIRADLNPTAPRVMCVLRPLKLVLTNYTAGETEELEAPYFPSDIGKEGSRAVPFTRELFIERDDFSENPPKGFHRLAPGREVRLRYGYIVKCVDVVKSETGELQEIHCTYDPDTRGGSASDGRKIKGTIHWVSAVHSLPVEVRLYDRLFLRENPDDVGEGEDFLSGVNPESLVVLADARIEPSVAADPPDTHYQFERQGYFYPDQLDSGPDSLVFNRTVTLRDSWTKRAPSAVTSGEAAAPKPPSEGPAQTAERIHRPNDAESAVRFDRFTSEFALPAEDAGILAQDADLSEYFERAVIGSAAARPLANWIINTLPRVLEGRRLSEFPVGPAELARLVEMVEAGAVSMRSGREVLAVMAKSGGSPDAIVEARGLTQISDRASLEPIIVELVDAHPNEVAAYRSGKHGLIAFFVGQVMRRTDGKADPEVVQELLRSHLG
ncbi:MAG: glutamine--tRNA ligase/YqeY domain fusion protein [Longimicrobiales bacterium]